tara:strand:+ start:8999 stop:9205 length:207 start_codon:yes stop_codon:yes gene_type:complete
MYDLQYEDDAKAEAKAEAIQGQIDGAYDSLLQESVIKFVKRLRDEFDYSNPTILATINEQLKEHIKHI